MFEPRLDFDERVLHFFGFVVEFAEVVGVDRVGLLNRLVAHHVVADLETDQTVRELALSGDRVVLAELHFEEDQHVAQVLVCLFIEHGVDLRVGVLLHLIKVKLQDEFAPDLNDLPIEGFRLLELTILFEKFAHVVVRGTHVDGFRTVLNTLEVDSFGQVLQSLSMRVSRVLGQEESTEGLV